MSKDDVTLLLRDLGDGREEVASRLIEAVYVELRRLAQSKMRRERADHTLQPTALVHEAFMRLVGSPGRLENRSHFFGAAAKAMERVLIDHARSKAADKRGGGGKRVSLQDVTVDANAPDLDVNELSEATRHLEELSPENAELVRLRYMLGLTNDEVAQILGVSTATVKRRWTFVRAWLYDRIEGDAERET